MIDQNSDESIPSTAAAERGCARQKSKSGTTGGRLAMFIHRRRDSPRGFGNPRQECKRDDDTAKTQMEHRYRDASSGGKVSFDFFRNIKKYLQIKNLCRSKQKSKEVSSPFHANQSAVIPVVEPIAGTRDLCQEQECSNDQQEVLSKRLSLYRSRLDGMLEYSCPNTEENVDNVTTQYSGVIGTNLNIVPIGQQVESACDIVTANDAIIMQADCSDTTVEVPSIVVDVPHGTNEASSNESKAKASLAEELLNLSKYGWYWGPISVDQADAKLISEPDGAFLVRDSSDDRYILTLSFKSSGKMLHARMEHSGGLFSLCNQRENEGFTSVAALINHSMIFSQSAVFCYSRPRYPGYPSFPVRLTKPVSRFTQVKSLQYLCRFVIRQYTSLDNIHKLPLPETIKLYILEAHY